MLAETGSNQALEILSLRDQAKNQLLQIRTVEDGISYLNKLKTIDVWVKAEKKDAELQNIIAEQKLRTQRLLGELIDEGQRKGMIASKGENQANLVHNGNKVKDTLPDIGITPKQSSAFKAIASIPTEQFEEFIQEKKQAVNDAVAELTTAGAVRLAKSLTEKDEIKVKVVEPVPIESEIEELAAFINSRYDKQQKQILISLIQ